MTIDAYVKRIAVDRPAVVIAMADEVSWALANSNNSSSSNNSSNNSNSNSSSSNSGNGSSDVAAPASAAAAPIYLSPPPSCTTSKKRFAKSISRNLTWFKALKLNASIDWSNICLFGVTNCSYDLGEIVRSGKELLELGANGK